MADSRNFIVYRRRQFAAEHRERHAGDRGLDPPIVPARSSRVVVILHADSAGPRQRIEQVIQLDRARFDQESVLREATPTCAVFRGEAAR